MSTAHDLDDIEDKELTRHHMPIVGIFVCLVTIILATLRLAGEKGQTFQAIAHIWVTWLFASAYYKRSWMYLTVGILITLVEVAAFFGFKLK